MLEPSWTVQGSTPGQPLGCCWVAEFWKSRPMLDLYLLYPAQKTGDSNSGWWKRNIIGTILHHTLCIIGVKEQRKARSFVLWANYVVSSVKYHISMVLKVDNIRSWLAIGCGFQIPFSQFPRVKIPEKGFMSFLSPVKMGMVWELCHHFQKLTRWKEMQRKSSKVAEKYGRG